MSAGRVKTWLVAYDIREPRRLRRVHQCIKREGTAVQYSAFAVEADDASLDALLQRLSGHIDRRADDVRAYHIPDHCQVWHLGRDPWPDGVQLTGSTAIQQLLQLTSPHPEEETCDGPPPEP